MLGIFRISSMFTSNCPDRSMSARPVVPSQTASTIIVCRPLKMSLWQERPPCIFAFKKLVSAVEIGSRYNVSSVTAMRYFKCVNHKPKELPEVVSLDEFNGNSDGQKYNSIVADPKAHKIFDILPDRDPLKVLRRGKARSDKLAAVRRSDGSAGIQRLHKSLP